jgi:beta-1,2-mannobiose phosphorylase / 1,2-beta-oligomannan phosphorylase
MKNQPCFHGFDLYVKNGEANLLYAFSEKKERFLRSKKSHDGLVFSDTNEHLKIASLLGRAENPGRIDDLAVSLLPEDKYFLTYTKKTHNSRVHLYGAISQKGINWKKTGLIEGVDSFGMVVPEYLFEKHHILFFGSHSIKIASSLDLAKWHITPNAILRPRKNSFDHSDLKVARILNVDEGIALFYFAKNIHKKLCLGVALLDKHAPGKVIWRAKFPLWEQPASWIANKTRILGIIQTEKEYVAYFEHGRGEVFVDKLRHGDQTEFEVLKKHLAKKSKRDFLPSLTRFPKNPIIEPKPENSWEAAATFNPAALYLDNRIHLIYRAQDHNGISVFGYAVSRDGVNIDERSENPIYFPQQDFEASRGKKTAHPYPVLSGGGWGGCEDPRLCQIEDRIYMIYIAFNGYQPPGVALTSIKTDNFLNKIWDWKKPKLISRPGQIQKNWVIFPEKINGKYAILHSISPKISVDYFDSLDSDETLIESHHNGQNKFTDKEPWDNMVRGVGPPPLKTNYGWLVFYHAMDCRDPNRYKIGAMLLDLQNPEKILARCSQPILEPDEKYENEGFKAGVVYVCGAVIKDKTLFVYYGGADTFVAVASSPLKEFVEMLISSGKVNLASKKIK